MLYTMNNFKLLSTIAITFTNLDDFDNQMNFVLKSIGKHFKVSRAYVFLDNETGTTTSNTYEWCNEGIMPQIKLLKNFSYEIIPSWKKMLAENGKICIDNIYALPDDIISVLQEQEVLSIIVYPLFINQKIMGFIGFDECKTKRNWKDYEIEILRIISGIISNSYTRKLIQDRLATSEKNLRGFFDTVDDLFIIGNTEGKILNANNAVIEKVGYSLAELKNMNIVDLHPQDKKAEAISILKDMLNRERVSCPLELESVNGNKIPVETRVWLGKWDEQECIFGIAKDLGKEQEALQKFTKTFENNPAAMAISSIEDGLFVDVNSSFLNKLGYLRSEVIGKTSSELELFVDLDNQREIIAELKKVGRIKDRELQVKCKNGSILTGLFSGEIINNQGKKSFLTVMVDITEKVALTKRIEVQRKRLENSIQGTRLGTWEWDIQTGEIIINERWAEMFGYTLQELQPISIETWKKLSHPDDLVNAINLLQQHFNKESNYYLVETRMKHKNGNWKWILDSGKVIEWNNDGKPAKMFGTHTDISLQKQVEEALAESEKRFDLALKGTEAGLWDWDMIHNTVFFSARWKRMLGFEDNEVENSFDGWKNLWHPDDASKIANAMSDYLNEKTANYEVVHRLRHKSGQWRWILARGGILRDSEGNPYRWVGTNIDITTEKENSEKLERFFSVNLDLLCIADNKGNFLKINPAWTDVLGYPLEELKQKNFLDLIHPGDMVATLKAIDKLKNQEQVLSFVNLYRCKDGSYRYLEWRSRPYGNLIYAAARDITDRIETEKRIREMSIRDSLTNVYNRRYIFERLEELFAEYIRNGKHFSISILDIDHFKKINDTYGHQAGDFILKEFTKVISNSLRLYDLLGRYGGEEFIVITLNASKEQTKPIIERILNNVRNEIFMYNKIEIAITFSAGISDTLEHNEVSVEKLIAQADKRLYEAKSTGRNKIII